MLNIELISVIQTRIYSSLSWEESHVSDSEPFCGKIEWQKHEIDDKTAQSAVHHYPEKREKINLFPSKFTTSGTSPIQKAHKF